MSEKRVSFIARIDTGSPGLAGSGMPATTQPLHRVLFDVLRDMDREADNQIDGHRTGLRWFNRWRRPEACSREGTEEAWTDELASRLWGRGLPAFHQVAYPRTCRSDAACDLVVSTSPTTFTWIEVKGAWQHNRLSDGATTWNKNYGKYLASSTASDFTKLLTLSRPEASAVGVLLVGFDSEATPMDDDVARMAGSAAAGWEGPETDQWSDRTVLVPGYRVRCWWWSRETPGGC